MPTSYALDVFLVQHWDHKCMCGRYELAGFTFIILSPIINVSLDTLVKKHPFPVRWRHGTRGVRMITGIYVTELTQKRGQTLFLRHSHKNY